MIITSHPRMALAGAAMLLALALFTGAEQVRAQRLVVCTASLSASGEAARLYAQSVDFSAGPLPGPAPLEGARIVGTPLMLPGEQAMILHAGYAPVSTIPMARLRSNFVEAVRPVPFEAPAASRYRAEPGWLEWPTRFLEGPMPAVVLLGRDAVAPESGQGKLELRAWDADAFQLGERYFRWELPGRPVDALVLPGQPDRVILLCQPGEGAAPQLLTGDLASGILEAEPLLLPLRGDVLSATAAGLAAGLSGQALLVMIHGYRGDAPARELTTWVWMLDGESLRPLGAPVEVPGRPVATQPLQAVGDTAWVMTSVPMAEYAYAARIRLTPSGMEKVVQHLLTGVRERCMFALDPTGTQVAAGLDATFELWPDGQRGGPRLTLEAPIRALAWNGAGLFVGEGGRVHHVSPADAQVEASVQLQSGQIQFLWPLMEAPVDDADGDGLDPATEDLLGADPWNPDSDGDGLHDGIDPSPTVSSPRLRLPAEILFSGKSVGRELRALTLEPGAAEDVNWRIVHDRGKMPWLVIHPASGAGPGVSYLGVDPALLSAAGSEEGYLQVHLEHRATGLPAYGSPEEVLVRITPRTGPVRRILWLWGAPESGQQALPPPEMKPLLDRLAGPPHFFTHEHHRGPLQMPLDQYAVLVLQAEAAVQGAVTRQSVLDYVAEDGALLFLGGRQTEPADAHADAGANAVLHSWLSPLGIHLHTGESVEGPIGPVRSHVLTRFWTGYDFTGATPVEAPRDAILAAAQGAGRSVFAATGYGYGRVSVLASPAPLHDTGALGQTSSFAAELFEWLARAGHERNDMDGDGIPDHIEDANDNGVVDPGETSFLHPDTDGDGIPDGMEDRNRNGSVEESETDPRNIDSDSDGIYDGADPRPLPPLDAPRILSVVPSTAPAEGGQSVLIQGRNLTPQTTFWFGEHPAPWARLFNSGHAEVWLPDAGADQGGAVTVRVDAGQGEEALLPEGFVYTPRSRVTIRLASQVYQYEGQAVGRMRLTLEPESPAPTAPPLTRAVLVIGTSAGENFRWGDAFPALPPQQGGVSVHAHAAEPGQIALELRPWRASAMPRTVVVELPWRLELEDDSPPILSVEVRQSLITTGHEAILAPVASPLQLTLPRLQ